MRRRRSQSSVIERSIAALIWSVAALIASQAAWTASEIVLANI